MGNYIIEFRLHGYAKKYAKQTMYDIANNFRVRGMLKKGKGVKVPHITLYGPFSTNNERLVISKVRNVCEKYDLVSFYFHGFNCFDNNSNKVIYMDIKPSKELTTLRHELAQALLPITSTISKEDKKGTNDFKFHSTLAHKDIDDKFSQIWKHMCKKEAPNIRQHLIRVTILRDMKILYEYDLIQHKLFDRRLSLSRYVFRNTMKMLKEHPEYGNTDFDFEPSDFESTEEQKEVISFWAKLKGIFGK